MYTVDDTQRRLGRGVARAFEVTLPTGADDAFPAFMISRRLGKAGEMCDETPRIFINCFYYAQSGNSTSSPIQSWEIPAQTLAAATGGSWKQLSARAGITVCLCEDPLGQDILTAENVHCQLGEPDEVRTVVAMHPFATAEGAFQSPFWAAVEIPIPGLIEAQALGVAKRLAPLARQRIFAYVETDVGLSQLVLERQSR